MGQAFLITLREGIEAALIVGIVLAYLSRSGHRSHFPSVWAGTALALLVSLAAGGVLFAVGAEFTGRAEEIFEGVAMFAAVVVLSYMVIWMKRQAVNIRGHLEAQVATAVAGGSAVALGLLAFVAVVREGLETALFMFAATRTATSAETLAGGILGLALAAALGYVIYRGSRVLKLKTFFNVTGVLLVLFAAGLLAHGIHEFEEAGVIPIIIEHVWDINSILNEKEGLGSFLAALFGYNGNPSLVEVVAYVLYLPIALWYFFSDRREAISTGNNNSNTPRAAAQAR